MVLVLYIYISIRQAFQHLHELRPVSSAWRKTKTCNFYTTHTKNITIYGIIFMRKKVVLWIHHCSCYTHFRGQYRTTKLRIQWIYCHHIYITTKLNPSKFTELPSITCVHTLHFTHATINISSCHNAKKIHLKDREIWLWIHLISWIHVYQFSWCEEILHFRAYVNLSTLCYSQ
jgi:hypothetical protein